MDHCVQVCFETWGFPNPSIDSIHPISCIQRETHLQLNAVTIIPFSNPPLFLSFPAVSTDVDLRFFHWNTIRNDFWQLTFDLFHFLWVATTASFTDTRTPRPLVCDRFPSPKKEMITWFPHWLFDVIFFSFTFFWHDDAPFPHDARTVCRKYQ